MPKTDTWLYRAALYLLAPSMVFTGLLVTHSPLLAGVGLFIGLCAELALHNHPATRHNTTDTDTDTDTERSNQL